MKEHWAELLVQGASVIGKQATNQTLEDDTRFVGGVADPKIQDSRNRLVNVRLESRLGGVVTKTESRNTERSVSYSILRV